MRDRGVVAAKVSDGLPEADWIVSAVTADQSLEAAETACAWLRPGQTFFDINSVSPDRKRATAANVNATGAVYIDMAVMAPVHPKGHRTKVLLAGPVAADMSGQLSALGFDFETVGSEAGAATAIKMVRSLFVKGLEAITVEALARLRRRPAASTTSWHRCRAPIPASAGRTLRATSSIER